MGQMGTHSTFCRARGALKIFRSLLGQWLGTATGKKNRGAIGLRGESPALAVRLGAQRGLFPLHLVAAEIAVDRRWPALPPHDCFALPTVILLGFWPYFLFDHWPHTAAVSLDRTALLRSELCGCFPAHACGSRRDALLSRPIHFTKGWRQLQAPTRRDNSNGAIEFPENGATKRAR